MLYIRRIVGPSMEPTLKHGSLVIFIKTKNYKFKDIVIAKINNREVVKRITRISSEGIELIGDNNEYSIDSRLYGLVEPNKIIGRLIFKLPKFY